MTDRACQSRADIAAGVPKFTVRPGAPPTSVAPPSRPAFKQVISELNANRVLPPITAVALATDGKETNAVKSNVLPILPITNFMQQT